MRLNSKVELYKYKEEYDEKRDANVETKELVSIKTASVEELSGNQYSREFGTFNRNVIRVILLQKQPEFTHIKYGGKLYKEIDSSRFKHINTYIAEEV